MVDENIQNQEEQVQEPTSEEIISKLSMAVENIQFFSNQVRFNSIIYEGISTILQKLTKIEEKLNGSQQ